MASSHSTSIEWSSWQPLLFKMFTKYNKCYKLITELSIFIISIRYKIKYGSSICCQVAKTLRLYTIYWWIEISGFCNIFSNGNSVPVSQRRNKKGILMSNCVVWRLVNVIILLTFSAFRHVIKAYDRKIKSIYYWHQSNKDPLASF